MIYDFTDYIIAIVGLIIVLSVIFVPAFFGAKIIKFIKSKISKNNKENTEKEWEINPFKFIIWLFCISCLGFILYETNTDIISKPKEFTLILALCLAFYPFKSSLQKISKELGNKIVGQNLSQKINVQTVIFIIAVSIIIGLFIIHFL